MGGVIASVSNKATFILQQLTGGDPRFADVDFRFAVGNYQGDPVELGGGGYGGDPDDIYGYTGGYSAPSAERAYTLQQAMTTNVNSVKSAISAWQASGGGDRPEGNFNAFQQLSLGDSGWRDNAGHILIWLGDAPSHVETVGEAEAIGDLQSLNIAVIGLNSSTYDSGIDAPDQYLDLPAGQATRVTNATKGMLAQTANMDDNSLADFILDSIDATVDTVCGSTSVRTTDTYSWQADPFPACVTGCYPSVTTRAVTCVRDRDHQLVASAKCNSATMPPAQQACAGDITQPECVGTCNPALPRCGNEPPDIDSCFAADTKILMADGREKNISDMKVGDVVMSFDKDKYNSPLHPERITHVFLNNAHQTYVIHGTKVTDSHKFMTASGKMKSIAEMTDADSIVMTNGTTVKRGEIKKGKIEKVYNFTVEHTHAYIADGKRVGNMTVRALPSGVYTEDALKKMVIYNDHVQKN